jgi:hypothetical protein
MQPDPPPAATAEDIRLLADREDHYAKQAEAWREPAGTAERHRAFAARLRALADALPRLNEAADWIRVACSYIRLLCSELEREGYRDTDGMERGFRFIGRMRRDGYLDAPPEVLVELAKYEAWKTKMPAPPARTEETR